MQVKTKIVWQIFSIIAGISIPIILYDQYVKSDYYNIQYFFVLITAPFFMTLFIFIIPTVRITFFEDKINVYWKIGMGKFHIYEMKKYQIYYKNVNSVWSICPVWFPIPLLMISGDGNNLVLGGLLTKKKETFKFLADHINPKVMDSSSRRILEKYKKMK
jgi:hypothetical protein